MMAWTQGLGPRGRPVWIGFDSLYNPRHRQRWIFVRLGIGLIVIHYVLLWIFGMLLFNGLNAESVDGLIWKSFGFVFLPGVASLIYAVWFCRKFIDRPWRLEVAYDELVYSRPEHWLKTKIAEWCNDSVLLTIVLILTLGWVEVIFDLFGQDDGSAQTWTARLEDVARVETDATARWKPARPGVIADTPVSGDEVQAFLFMADGSRHVIASVHGGREDMAKLSHSIRSWIERHRQDERFAVTQRPQPREFREGEGLGEGFNI